MCRKNTVYLGFGTTCRFRHPLGDLGLYPPRNKGGNYCICAITLSPLRIARSFYCSLEMFSLLTVLGLHEEKCPTQQHEKSTVPVANIQLGTVCDSSPNM